MRIIVIGFLILRHLVDIDECTSINDVCMNGRCQNTPGDYVCRCNTGYTLSTDKHMCLGKYGGGRGGGGNGSHLHLMGGERRGSWSWSI